LEADCKRRRVAERLVEAWTQCVKGVSLLVSIQPVFRNVISEAMKGLSHVAAAELSGFAVVAAAEHCA
jgi:hypothetical protein